LTFPPLFVQGTEFNAKDYGAVGNGVADDTAAIQALLNAATNGSIVVFPAGSTFKCSAMLIVPAGRRYTLTGGGTLAYTSAAHLTAAGKPSALRILGDGTVLRDLRITNPNEITGVNTFGQDTYNQGIRIEAHGVTVVDCVIDRWQQGIVVEPTGEWLDTIIARNRVSNILGRGGGASDTTTNNGEDGGDGIVIWGARSTVIGNIVSAKAGRDARIGIHSESLAGFEVTPSPYSNSTLTIAGNVVFGPFRRGIATEGVSHASITGNVVSDATWWAIAVIDGYGNVVSGNSIRWTRTSSDNQGGAWNPSRAPLHIRKGAVGCVLADNVVTVYGSATSYVHILAEGTRPQYPQVRGNSFTVSGGVVAEGIKIEGADSPVIADNVLTGVTAKLLYAGNTTNCNISGNRFRGQAGVGIGIDVNGVPGVVASNEIRDVPGTAINAVNQAEGSQISMNNIVGTSSAAPTAIGIELWGTAGPTSVVGNRFVNVTSKLSNGTGANVISSGNN
jgi:parallel beta-helix repeat protein